MLLLPREGRVEGLRRRLEVRASGEGQRVPGPVLTVHPRIFPLDAEGPLVADTVQRPDAVLQVHVTVARGDEVPTALGAAEVQVASQYAPAAVQPLAAVLDVEVVDPIGELLDERCGVEELVGEVARVEVDTEALAVADGVESLAGAYEVVGDLRGVHLQAPPDALLVEDVDDRVPALREVLVAALYLLEVVGRERVEQVPDARSRKAVDLRYPKAGRGPGSVHDLLGGTPAHAFRVAVAPHVGRKRRPVAGVYGVADRLADQVGAYGPAVQAVAAEYLPAPLYVAALRERTVYIEVVPPARELEPVETPLPALTGELFQRKVSPLSRKKCYRSGHVPTSSYSLPRGPAQIRPYSLAPLAFRSAAPENESCLDYTDDLCSSGDAPASPLSSQAITSGVSSTPDASTLALNSSPV